MGKGPRKGLEMTHSPHFAVFTKSEAMFTPLENGLETRKTAPEAQISHKHTQEHIPRTEHNKTFTYLATLLPGTID